MKRLPIIRHIRYFLLLRQVNRHYDYYLSLNLGMSPVNLDRDYEILDAIWRGDAV